MKRSTVHVLVSFSALALIGGCGGRRDTRADTNQPESFAPTIAEDAKGTRVLTQWDFQASPRDSSAGRYDAAREVTIRGTILDTKSFPARGDRPEMVGVRIHSQDGVAHVILAPPDFLGDMPLNMGTKLEVVGSAASSGGQSVLIARTIRKGATTLELRDASGQPFWPPSAAAP